MAGYSGTSLSKKLGIKNGFKIKLINAPDYYFHLFTDLPSELTICNDESVELNFIHCFVTNSEQLTGLLPQLKKQIEPDGMIWVSWYKKSAKMQSDIAEDLIREIALNNGLVDIKVCAVNELWSALKLVIPVNDRNKIR